MNENQSTRDLLKLHFAPQKMSVVDALRARAKIALATAAMSPEERQAYRDLHQVQYSVTIGDDKSLKALLGRD